MKSFNDSNHKEWCVAQAAKRQHTGDMCLSFKDDPIARLVSLFFLFFFASLKLCSSKIEGVAHRIIFLGQEAETVYLGGGGLLCCLSEIYINSVILYIHFQTIHIFFCWQEQA